MQPTHAATLPHISPVPLQGVACANHQEAQQHVPIYAGLYRNNKSNVLGTVQASDSLGFFNHTQSGDAV